MILEEICADTLRLATRSELASITKPGLFLDQVEADRILSEKYLQINSEDMFVVEKKEELYDMLARREFFYYQECNRVVQKLQEQQISITSQKEYEHLLKVSSSIQEIISKVDIAIKPKTECNKIITDCKNTLSEFEKQRVLKEENMRKQREETSKKIKKLATTPFVVLSNTVSYVPSIPSRLYASNHFPTIVKGSIILTLCALSYFGYSLSQKKEKVSQIYELPQTLPYVSSYCA